MCHFCFKSCWWQPSPHHHHALCEDLGVKAGFKARFVCQCVCVCVCWERVFRGLGGLVSDGGRRSYCLPAFTRRGMDHQMYMCVCEKVCVLLCEGRTCRLCIGRGSSAFHKVTKHTNALTQITQLKKWRPFLRRNSLECHRFDSCRVMALCIQSHITLVLAVREC